VLDQTLIPRNAALFAVESLETAWCCVLVCRGRRERGPVDGAFQIGVNCIATPNEGGRLSGRNDRPKVVLLVLVVAGTKGDSVRWWQFDHCQVGCNLNTTDTLFLQ